jgi:hypothetical protein
MRLTGHDPRFFMTDDTLTDAERIAIGLDPLQDEYLHDLDESVGRMSPMKVVVSKAFDTLVVPSFCFDVVGECSINVSGRENIVFG